MKSSSSTLAQITSTLECTRGFCARPRHFPRTRSIGKLKKKRMWISHIRKTLQKASPLPTRTQRYSNGLMTDSIPNGFALEMKRSSISHGASLWTRMSLLKREAYHVYRIPVLTSRSKKRTNGGLFPSQEIIDPTWTTTNGNIYPLWLLLLHQFAAGRHLKAALAKNGSYHRKFLHDLVLTLYEDPHNGDEDDGKGIISWKRRHRYYVHTADNPVALD